MICKKTEYRQRVYKLEDGTIQFVFGNDAAPLGGGLISDHDVTELVTIVDHVGPEPLTHLDDGVPV